MKYLLTALISTFCYAQIINTGDPKLDFIIGPQVPVGSSAITQPFFDTAFQASATLAYQNHLVSTNYAVNRFAPWYRNFKAGTISVTSAGGTTTVTGTSTNFIADVCAGSSPPSHATFISWPYTGKNDGLQHYTMQNVQACPSNTTLTMNAAYPASPPDELPVCTPCSGMQYSTTNDGDGNFFTYGSQPEDYYDNGMASKILFVRKGSTTDRDGYRNIVDQHWQSPEFDQGYAYTDNGNAWFPARRGESRTYALDGVFIRAMDGRADYWKGLRIIGAYVMTTHLQPQNVFVIDQRDGAYDIRTEAIGCFTDPDATEKTNWCNRLRTGYDNLLKNTQNGGGQDFYGQWYSGISSFDGGGGTVSITGTTVTLVGRTWAAADLLPFPGSMTSGLMIFNTPGTNPGTNAGGFYGCTWATSTTCTGLTGWTGGNVSGKGFAVPNATYGVVGMVGQPFMVALLVSACELAVTAMNAVGDFTYAANFAHISDLAVNWLQTYGYYTAEKGMYYFSSANCQPGTTLGVCTSASNTNQTRAFAIETPYGLALSYKRTASGATKSFIQTLLDSLWTQRTCNANPQYLADWDSTCAGFGFALAVVAGQPGPGNPKYYGQCCGVGNTSTVFAILSNPVGSVKSGVVKMSGQIISH